MNKTLKVKLQATTQLPMYTSVWCSSTKYRFRTILQRLFRKSHHRINYWWSQQSYKSEWKSKKNSNQQFPIDTSVWCTSRVRLQANSLVVEEEELCRRVMLRRVPNPGTAVERVSPGDISRRRRHPLEREEGSVGLNRPINYIYLACAPLTRIASLRGRDNQSS